MTFEECIESLHEGSVISFKEYTYDRHEHKKLTLSIQDGVVQAVFPANKPLSQDVLTQYYGENLEAEEYLQLSIMSCPRVVVGLGIKDNEMDVKIIILNKDFYNTGLQEVSITNEVNLSTVEPNYNYMMSQGGWA